MKAMMFAAALTATFATAALAQNDQGQTDRRVDDLKGPPNANGFDKSGKQPAAPDVVDTTPSAKDMKGPPNANGFNKK